MFLSQKYSHLRDFIARIPQLMLTEGETVYAARNLIKVLRAPDGTLLNVKRYHRPSLPNAIIYSTGLRTPKGLRAFTYPQRLIAAGIETPEAVAYIEERHGGLLGYSYFISLQCPYQHRFYEVIDLPAEQYTPLAEALGRMAAQMHNAQMLHRDFSPGNILWDITDGTYHFSIVDINRMRFGEVSLAMGCANFARLWGPTSFFETLARSYAAERHMDAEECVRVTLECRRKFWTNYKKHHKMGVDPFQS
jgi:hypothetical protein